MLQPAQSERADDHADDQEGENGSESRAVQKRHDDAGGGEEHQNVVETVGVLQQDRPSPSLA
jgi:hypothetical protein